MTRAVPFGRAVLLVLAMGLAACEAPNGAGPTDTGSRDRSVPISSTTRGTPEDMSGQWVVERALTGGKYATAGDRIQIAVDTSENWQWTITSGTRAVRFATETTLPGRYRLVTTNGARGGAGAPELWVLWVDDDFRTAVIGTPDGAAGWIMNRPGRASGDRTRAAQEILDFNGYDPADFAG
jgi:apolipoprotein D and lipocalin family protein